MEIEGERCICNSPLIIAVMKSMHCLQKMVELIWFDYHWLTKWNMKNEKRNQLCKKRIHWRMMWKWFGSHEKTKAFTTLKSRWSWWWKRQIKLLQLRWCEERFALLSLQKQGDVHSSNATWWHWSMTDISSSSSCSSRELTCKQQGQGDKHNPRSVRMHWNEICWWK